jgi:hypothetical protein
MLVLGTLPAVRQQSRLYPEVSSIPSAELLPIERVSPAQLILF